MDGGKVPSGLKATPSVYSGSAAKNSDIFYQIFSNVIPNVPDSELGKCLYIVE